MVPVNPPDSPPMDPPSGGDFSLDFDAAAVAEPGSTVTVCSMLDNPGGKERALRNRPKSAVTCSRRGGTIRWRPQDAAAPRPFPGRCVAGGEEFGKFDLPKRVDPESIRGLRPCGNLPWLQPAVFVTTRHGFDARAVLFLPPSEARRVYCYSRLIVVISPRICTRNGVANIKIHVNKRWVNCGGIPCP